jgi:hypothetical protein
MKVMRVDVGRMLQGSILLLKIRKLILYTMSEEGGDGEGAPSGAPSLLSYTLRLFPINSLGFSKFLPNGRNSNY